MQGTEIALVTAVVGVAMLLSGLLVWRFYFSKRGPADGTAVGRVDSIDAGIARLHQDPESRRPRHNSNGYHVFRRGISGKPSPSPGHFNWADYPSLITDAVENGWAQFAFRRTQLSSPSARSALLGLCAAGDTRDDRIDIGWELCSSSAEFVQKIRFNSGSNHAPGSSTAAASAIRAGLPLPGPPLEYSSFPQEAYFEITVLGNEEGGGTKRRNGEGERTKLIPESPKLKANSVRSGSGMEEMKMEDGGGEAVALSLGLTAAGALPLKLPGSYQGSVGFNSNGSVFLDGVEVAFESEMAGWGQTNTVIGCGFNPSLKKVFFTVDSELVRVVQCKSEEFGSPLFPTLAANADISVVVNFGQNVFQYAPANAQRTPNPCFIGTPGNPRGPALGSEDSRELFSMGRIDSQWLNRSGTNRNSYGHNNAHNNNNNSHKAGSEFDQDSEADLFEINVGV